MFQFPGFAPSHDGTGSSIQWVAPFGDARINSCLQIPEPFRSLPRPSSPPDSLGILRSLFFPFSCYASAPSGASARESRIFRLVLLLPIEIVVRKFRFDNFFIRLTLSFALPLIYSLSIFNELYPIFETTFWVLVSNGTAKVDIIFELANFFLLFFDFFSLAAKTYCQSK